MIAGFLVRGFLAVAGFLAGCFLAGAGFVGARTEGREAVRGGDGRVAAGGAVGAK